MPAIEEAIAIGTKDGRICPQPQRWNELWELLPNSERKGASWTPPLPLILDAWWETSDSQKQERFREHLLWTEKHNAFGAVLNFLKKLQNSDWHFKE